jgi:aminopeptidase
VACAATPDQRVHLKLENLQPAGSFKLRPIGNAILSRPRSALSAGVHTFSSGNSALAMTWMAKRIGITQAARKPLMDTFMKRAAEGKLHWVGTQFPSQGAAQDAEMSLAEYEDFVFNAGLLNKPDPVAAWKQVSQRQQRLADFLNGKREYSVVAANGTDVRMSV